MNYIKKPYGTFPKLNFLNDYLIGHSGFIAGGCFKDIFLGKSIKDIDIFFPTEKDFKKGRDKFKKNRQYRRKYSNENVECYTDVRNNINIELVKRYFGQPEDIFKLFDFSITKFAYYIEPQNKSKETSDIKYVYYYSDRFFEDLLNKKLVIDENLPLPFNTFERSYKYTRYGFNLCKESKIKLLESIRNGEGELGEISKSLYFGLD